MFLFISSKEELEIDAVTLMKKQKIEGKKTPKR